MSEKKMIKLNLNEKSDTPLPTILVRGEDGKTTMGTTPDLYGVGVLRGGKIIEVLVNVAEE